MFDEFERSIIKQAEDDVIFERPLIIIATYYIIFLLLVKGCGFSNLNKMTIYNNISLETPNDKYNIVGEFENALFFRDLK